MNHAMKSIVRSLVLSLICAAHAQAATLTVTSTAGTRGGPNCTLRDAISAAETDAASGGCPAGSGADTIQLPAAATITLTTRETTGATDPDALALPIIGFDLTIEGNNSTIQRDVTLGCDPQSNTDQPERFGLLTIDAALMAPNVVTLRNLTLRNGCRMNGDSGGAIEISGSIVTLDNVAFEDNHAWGGGAVRFTANGASTALLTVTGSRFDDNVARVYGGGAISATGPFTVTDSHFEGNETSGIGTQGGAIYTAFAIPASDSATVTDSSFRYNMAAPSSYGQGGAIHHSMFAGTLNLYRNTFEENSAGSGGAVLVGGGTVVLRDSTFLFNHAVAGSGGAVAVSSASADLTVRRSLFDSNTATAWGGALLNYGHSHLFNSTFSNNIANIFGTVNGGGGAIANEANAGPGSGVLDASFISFIHNTAMDGNEDGGTLTNASFTAGASMTIANSFIAATGGHAPQGSGTQCFFNEAPVMVGFNFANDTSCTGFTSNTVIALDDAVPTDHGGRTGTFALAPGSAAIDGGNCSIASGATNTADQRQASRPFDGDGNGIARCDVGAYEYVTNPRLEIFTTGDGEGTVTAAGIDCGGADGDCLDFPAAGSTVTMSALPSSGSFVASWTGCTSTSPDLAQCSITNFNADTDVTVSFGVTASPASADMSATLSGLPSAAVAGAALNGTLTCTNHGAQAAPNANCVVSGLPPATVVTCTPSAPVASLAVDASIVCNLSFTMPNGNVNVLGTASASAVDLDNGNNIVGQPITRTSANADLRVQLAQVPQTTLPGEPVQFIARCGNVGPATALNVTCDVSNLPVGATIQCDHTLPIAALAPFDYVQCLVVYPAPASGTQTVFLSATSTSPDPTPANNNANAPTRVLDADMEVSNLSAFPTTANEGALIDASYFCRNTGPDAAVDATCTLNGLPAGATILCTPAQPVASLALNARIDCVASFTMPATSVALSLIAANRANDADTNDNTVAQTVNAIPNLIFGNGFE